jgi:hypothetical protein
MATPFDRPARQGEVRGVKVAARPLLFGHVRRMMEAEADDNARLLCMVETVRECVTTEGGEPLDVDQIDVATLAELYGFAAGAQARPTADFTPPASPAAGAPAQT